MFLEDKGLGGRRAERRRAQDRSTSAETIAMLDRTPKAGDRGQTPGASQERNERSARPYSIKSAAGAVRRKGDRRQESGNSPETDANYAWPGSSLTAAEAVEESQTKMWGPAACFRPGFEKQILDCARDDNVADWDDE